MTWMKLMLLKTRNVPLVAACMAHGRWEQNHGLGRLSQFCAPRSSLAYRRRNTHASPTLKLVKHLPYFRNKQSSLTKVPIRRYISCKLVISTAVLSSVFKTKIARCDQWHCRVLLETPACDDNGTLMRVTISKTATCKLLYQQANKRSLNLHREGHQDLSITQRLRLGKK